MKQSFRKAAEHILSTCKLQLRPGVSVTPRYFTESTLETEELSKWYSKLRELFFLVNVIATVFCRLSFICHFLHHSDAESRALLSLIWSSTLSIFVYRTQSSAKSLIWIFLLISFTMSFM
ncbi:unnamed protein product [Ixodes pacificus]